MKVVEEQLLNISDLHVTFVKNLSRRAELLNCIEQCILRKDHFHAATVAKHSVRVEV